MTSAVPQTAAPTIVVGLHGEADESSVEALVEAGAGEFFLGYVPPYWSARFGFEFSPNRRYVPRAQVTEAGLLRRLCAAAARLGVPVSLAFNEHAVTVAAFELGRRLIAEAAEAGVASLIVADPAVVPLVRTHFPDLRVHASGDTGITNAAGAELLFRLGASRLIFPRELPLPDLLSVVRASQDEGRGFEAFIMGEPCVFDGARCFTDHGYGLPCDFCNYHSARELRPRGKASGRSLEPKAGRLLADPAVRAAWLLGRCGLCAIPALAAGGVTHLKIPGRASAALAATRLVHRMLHEPEPGLSDQEKARRLLAVPKLCGSKSFCYYELNMTAVSCDSAPLRASPGLAMGHRPSTVGGITGQRRGSRSPREIACHFSDPAALRRERAFLATHDIDSLAHPRHPLEQERKAWDQTRAALETFQPGSGRCCTRLYLGNEFCPFLAWTRRETLDAAALARDRGFDVTLVLGPVRDLAWPATLELLEAARAALGSVEVVANDWGTLAVAAQAGHRPVAGRFLVRMKRLPRVNRRTRPQFQGGDPLAARAPEALLAAQLEQYSQFPWDAPWALALASSLGLCRAESDLVPQGIRFPADSGLPVSLHSPFAYVTGGGHCPAARIRRTANGEVCGRACRRTWIELHYPTPTLPLVQIGHTVFAMLGKLIAPCAATERIDRIVVTRGLAM